ncbi:DNA cytosine methyltransferase [Halomonas sp. LBP4]|uniref:DNA cytosine methyltransferase n=1 Tax=Halomonas sp. LBP4 TaxID=2044917 RepID=UPI000D774533|nr:DNA cytosine methyltransferase [Halomonas sp. LBP4]PXX98295.1 DNA (cytosine-5-)-methyltransferase [Halomonas sp. LBP4]
MDAIPTPLRFADVFAGCGGLSLGLLQAGCQGVFAVEKNPLAFETFRHNLIDGERFGFDWPEWLPKSSMTCEELLDGYSPYLEGLRGSIDIIVGGPPCQGFSTAGRRDPSDPRNQMTKQYLTLIEMLKPRYLVIENVAGYDMRFEDIEGVEGELKKDVSPSYADSVEKSLEELGYSVSRGLVNCSDYGVPQNRMRYLFICECDDGGSIRKPGLLEELRLYKEDFLNKNGLPRDKKITVREAIGDLLTAGRSLVENLDSGVKGFKEVEYQAPLIQVGYIELMRKWSNGKAPNSLRLANHKKKTIEYFKKVQATCRPGRTMTQYERKLVGTKKHSTTVLHPDKPASTITTLPDDILHYCEPRILTVRENARLQSFPDWFSFKGKYTTGGKNRKQECPRYTQVGNAVPPLLANAIGEMLFLRQCGAPTQSERKVEGNQQPSPSQVNEMA